MLKINTPAPRLGRQNADMGKFLIVNGFETGEKQGRKFEIGQTYFEFSRTYFRFHGTCVFPFLKKVPQPRRPVRHFVLTIVNAAADEKTGGTCMAV